MTKSDLSERSFWKKLRIHYRLQLIDTDTYDVRWVLQLSRLNILTLGTGVFVLFLVLAFLFFSFTPMKYLLPGFVGTNADDKRDLINLKMKSEEFDKELLAYKTYVDNLMKVVGDSIGLHEDYTSEQMRLLQADTSLFFPQPGKLESQFRKDFELLLKQGDDINRNDKLFVLNNLHNPADGKPLPASQEEAKSSTLKIKTNGDAGITSVLGGIVIALYKLNEKVHVFIQHEDFLVSAYRFEGVSKVVQGEQLDKGQLIGIMSDKGERILYLDLWANAESIPPGQYLKY
jgi:hypothetical protein